MDLKILLLSVLITISCIVADYVSYKNHVLYKVVPETEQQVKDLIDLQDQNEYNFWLDTVKLGTKQKIMVTPEKVVKFEEYLTEKGINATVISNDIQRIIDEQMKRPTQISRNALDYAWDYYPSLEEIEEWMEKIVEAHPNVATLVTAGRSVEGRYIRGIKIDFKKRTNPVIGMIEGTLHAREWITPVTSQWIIKEFLTSTDENVREVAENVVWHIFPVVNPDGYLYTFTHNRMWRKNRSNANFVSCAEFNLDDDLSNGVDLNRNFGFLWMTVGASSNPCMQTYAGPFAFSEPESIAVANYVTRLQREGNLLYYFALHSYSNMILVPYSHLSGADVLEAPNYGDMFEIAIKGADALTATHGTEYMVGTSKDILYEVSGSGFDWVKGGAKVPLVFLFEFRDTGEYGFLLPTDQIIPNSEEVMAAIVEMDKTTRSLGYYRISSGSVFRLSTLLLAFAVFIGLKM